MAKCVIILPLYDGCFAEETTRQDGDFVICADAGYARAKEYGLSMDMIVGDFDSLGYVPQEPCVVKQLPIHKDDTDTAACIKEARRLGYKRFVLAGGVGGRLDMTIDMLQVMADCAQRGEDAVLLGQGNYARMLPAGSYIVPKRAGCKLSFYAFGGKVSGLNLRGVAYPLTDATLTSTVPLGTSNEWAAEQAEVSFASGLLLMVHAKDASLG